MCICVRDGPAAQTSAISRGEWGSVTSAPDPVVHVGDTVLPLEDAGALELDLLGSEALEQTAPLAEEHRDDMKLELVEDARRECKLGDCGAVNKHVLVARSLLCLAHRGFDVGHVSDERPLADVNAGLPAAVDEDWDAVGVVATAAPGRREGPPT